MIVIRLPFSTSTNLKIKYSAYSNYFESAQISFVLRNLSQLVSCFFSKMYLFLISLSLFWLINLKEQCLEYCFPLNIYFYKSVPIQYSLVLRLNSVIRKMSDFYNCLMFLKEAFHMTTWDVFFKFDLFLLYISLSHCIVRLKGQCQEIFEKTFRIGLVRCFL